MKPLYRNVFLAIGVVAIIIMLCTSDLSYSELWDNVRRAGYWFPAVILRSEERRVGKECRSRWSPYH